MSLSDHWAAEDLGLNTVPAWSKTGHQDRLKMMQNMTRLIVTLILSTALLVQTSVAAIPLNPQNPGPSDAERYAQMVQMFEFWRELDRRLDRTQFDPVALGRQLETPQAAFEWVRDQTRPVPYKGVLRGARGVLQDRQGNSLDRALLLAEMLEAQGHSVRLARGEIEEESVVADLNIQWSQSFDPWLAADTGQMGQLVMEVLKDQIPQREAELVQSDWLLQEAEESAPWVDAIDRISKRIEQRLGPSFSADSRAADDAWRDHWWVEFEQADEWQILDPSAEHSGRSVSGPEIEVFAAKALPASLFHRVRFDVVAVTRQDGERLETVLVEAFVRPHELDLPLVSIQMVPGAGSSQQLLMDGLAHANPVAGLIAAYQGVQTWVPMIQAGPDTYTDLGIRPDGQIVDNLDEPVAARAMSESLGLLSGVSVGGLQQDVQSESKWLSTSVVMTYQRPGFPDEQYTRKMFDLESDGFSSATQQVIGAPSSLQAFGAMARESHYFLQTSMLSPQWFMDQLVGQILSNDDLHEALMEDPSLDLSREPSQLIPSVPELLLEFMANRYRIAEHRSSTGLDQLGLTALHRGQWPLSQSEMVFEQTLDVVNSGARNRSVGEPSNQGVVDSVMEWRTLGSRQVIGSGAKVFFESPHAEVDGWILMKSESDWRSSIPSTRLNPPPVFLEAWAAGRWVLAEPGRDDDHTGVGDYWWDIDHQSGDALVRDLLGHGSASVMVPVSSLGLSLVAASISLETVGIAVTVSAFWGGLGYCMVESMNFGCCLLFSGLFLGLGMAVSGFAGIRAGIGFDLITSPFSEAAPVTFSCPDLLERERERSGGGQS